MNSVATQATLFRDPMAPGAPIIPRAGWSRPPFHRWTFQHIREMTPTAQVWRGPGPVMPMPEAPQDLGTVEFEHGGRRRTVEAFLEPSATDGLLVLHRGRIVYERYLNGMTPHGQHLSMSVAKSIVGTLAGILAWKGVIDLAAPVPEYLPELAATAYREATVQHLLDMSSGVTFDESYTTPGSHMQRLGYACGWWNIDRPEWPRTLWQLILTLTEQDAPHGEVFRYRSIETDVLGFLLERATGTRLAELTGRELWAPMGAGEDACFTVDHGGGALADGGFCATLRDYGRFALLLLNGGRHGERQVVPEHWVPEIRGGRGGRFEGDHRLALPRGGYHNKFWIEDMERGTFMARGIFGQFIYLDPDADFAAVKLSTWPEVINVDWSGETRAAFHAMRAALGGP